MKRPYQQEAEDGVFREFAAGHQSTLVVMPTGTGKTFLFGHVVKRWLDQHATGDVLVLAHREELIFQARDELAPILGFVPGIEMADLTVTDGGFWHVPRVVIGSVQSLWRPGRLAKFDADRFGLIVVDEAHHCTPQCRTYWNILKHFTTAKVLGVTATPLRADKLALGQTFESVAYRYDIADAVDDGWLVPVEQQFVQVTGLDFRVVGTLAGDLNTGELDAQMRAKRALYEVSGAILETCGLEPTLVFTVSVDHGLELASILNDHKPGSAVCLHGGTDPHERRRQLERYERGEYQYLLGCALFTEGFNCPRISRVVMARPTESIVYYTQAIGRGTRTLRGVLTPDLDTPEKRRAAIAASAKPRVVVLDFVGNSGKHKLVSAVDVLAGKHGSAAVARVKAAATVGAVDVAAALDHCEAEIQREEKAEQERKDRRERARLNAKARVATRQVDPFDRSDVGGTGRATSRPEAGGPATPKQTEFLKKYGIWKEGSTGEEAQRAIKEVHRRWDGGLCTVRQAKTLTKFGYSPDTPKEWAAVLIDLIAARGWKRPDYPMTRDRLAIVRAADGYRVKVRDDVKGSVTVGKPFKSPEQVREKILPHLAREVAFAEHAAA